MSKRKRDHVLDEESMSRKKRKLAKQRKKQKKASQQVSNRLEQPAKSTPSTHHVTQAPDTKPVTVTLEPPPGLTKHQRRRWRKRQSKLRKALDPDRQVIRSSTQPQALPQPPSKQPPQESDNNVVRRRLDRDAVLQAASTRLMVRRKNVWHDDGPAGASEEGVEISNADGTGKRLRPEVSATVEPPGLSVQKSINRAANQPKPAIRVAQVISTTSEKSSTSQDSPILIRQPEIRLKVPKLPRASARRTSFGQKVNSIPSVTSSGDPAAAFKRFSAFINNGDSDDSSEDSESSDSGDDLDDGDTTGNVVTPAGVANQIDRPQATSHAPRHDHIHSDASVTGAGPDSDSHDKAKESATRISIHALLQPTASTSNGQSTASRRANVGIKRQTSSLAQPTGGPLSGNDSAPPVPATTTTPYSTRSYDLEAFNVSEADSRNALQIMEDLTESMLTTTRALPASKFDQGLAPRSDDGGTKGLTNVESSYTGMNDVPTTLARFRSFEGSHAEITGQRVSVICKTVRVEADQDLHSHQQTGGQPETSETSASSNIIVKTREHKHPSSGSSTPLSVLSKTPTPPAQSAPPESRSYAQKPVDLGSEIEGGIKPSSASPVPAKKRKMTGRTSKHFTPQKQPRRRKSKAAMELELASTTDTTDENESIGQVRSAPRAEDELKSTFRSEGAIRALRTPVRRSSRIQEAKDEEEYERSKNSAEEEIEEIVHADGNDEDPNEKESTPPAKATRKKRKSTGKKSTYFTPQKPTLDTTYIDRVDLYNTTGSTREGRVPAGVSIAPVPSIHSATFGIIQEKLWREPFWLLIAVTFLNKTTGRAAAPTFWKIKQKYKTAESLAEADDEELREMINHLGLQTQRSRRCVKMAKAWVEEEPMRGRRWRCLHYPVKGDGKDYKKSDRVDEDGDEVGGALEIAHIPGCGPYAWDSWRIFCRDVLRGVAEDYNGLSAGEESFVPEWKKVLPLDKELRACLRWMWLREGWIWDCVSGERRAASGEEMERAVKGEAEIDDPVERKFAAQAAGKEDLLKEMDIAEEMSGGGVSPTAADKEDTHPEAPPSTPKMSAGQDSSDVSSNIEVTPRSKQGLRRSRRLSSS